MSTAGKLWLGYGLLLLLLVATGLFVAHRLASIERALSTIMAVQEPATAATYEMAVNVVGTRSAVLNYASTGEDAQRERLANLDADYARFKTHFDRVARSLTSRELALRIDAAHHQFRAIGDTLMRLSDRQRSGATSFARHSEALGAKVAELTTALEGKGRDDLRRYVEVVRLEADVTGIDAALNQFLRARENRYRARVTFHQGRFEQTLAELRRTKLDDPQRELVERLRGDFESFVGEAREVMWLAEETRAARERFTEAATPVERLVAEGIRSLARNDLVDAQQSARQAIRTSLIAVLLLLVAGILIGSGTAIPTGRSIVRADQALRERMQDLAASHRRKDDFLGVLGHELRNPLAPLTNALHVLEARAAEVPKDVRGIHDMMQRQVRSMSRLVDDLLDVSRINEGKITLRREIVDLAAVAAQTAEDLRPLVEAHQHGLRIALPEKPAWVNADPTRVGQIVGNLLHNAIKYTPDGGRIALVVERSDRQVLLRVEDSGIGIEPQLLQRVFEPYTQGDVAKVQGQGGLGIGLTLVQRLVELHGGRTSAESPGPGRGSTFTVRFPASAAPPEPAAAPAPAAAGARARRILVVDDNQDSANSMAALLQLWGHEVEVAHDGPAALAAAARQRPDLALLDIGLPGLDGYEVARRLRRDPGGRWTTLIALTGLGQEEDRQRALDSGFDRHLTKPVSPEALRELIT